MRVSWSGVEWGDPAVGYHLYWWNWLPPEARYWGYEQYWYDGPYMHFGLWFTNISWRMPWTKWNGPHA